MRTLPFAPSTAAALAALFYCGVSAPISAQVTYTYLNGQDVSTARNTSPPNDPTTLFVASASDTGTQSGAISGTGGVIKDGLGVLRQNGTGSYTGATTFTSGTFSFATVANGGANSSLGAASTAASNLVFNGGTLRYTGLTGSTNRAFTINANGGSIEVTDAATTLSFTGGNVANSATAGAFTKAGAGKLTLSGTTLTTKDLTIAEGTLQWGGTPRSFGTVTAGTVSPATIVVPTGVTWELGPFALRAGRLESSGTMNRMSSGNATNLAVGGSSVTVALDAGIWNAGTFNFGAGTTAATLQNGSQLNADFIGLSPSAPATTSVLLTGGSSMNSTIVLSLSGLSSVTVASGSRISASEIGIYDAATLNLGAAEGAAPAAAPGLITATSQFHGTGTVQSNHTGTVVLPTVFGLKLRQNAGLTVLLGQNFLGASTLLGGTLQLGEGGSGETISGGPLNLSGGTFAYRSGTFSMTMPLTGSTGAVQIKSGNLMLANDNSFSGTTTIDAGTQLAFGMNSTGGSNGSVAGPLVINGTLVIDRSGFYTLSQPVTGTGTLRVLRSGGVSITSDVVVGSTRVDQGTLEIGAGATVGSLGGAIEVNTMLDFRRDGTLLVDGAISGTGSVRQSGLGTTRVTAANGYTGGTTLNAGTLALGHNSALGSGALAINGGGLRSDSGARTLANPLTLVGNLTLGRSMTLNGAVALNGFPTVTSANPDVGAPAVSTFGGNISGTGGFDFAEGINPTGVLVLSGANTYIGGNYFTGGIVSIGLLGDAGTAGNLGAAPADGSFLQFRGGTLRYTGATAASNRGFLVASGGGAFEISNAATQLTLSGAITGTGILTKRGPGALVLSANATLGALRVAEGAVTLGSSRTFNTSATGAIGTQAGLTAAAPLSGTGALWNVGSDLAVGASGPGSLTLGPGTQLTDTFAAIGRPNAAGSVLVNGGSWQNSSALVVGLEGGTGSVALTAAGTVTNTTAVLGREAGSVGAVSVSGPNSTWTSSGLVTVGDQGSGTVVLADSGRLIANAGLTLGAAGAGGGTLNFGAIEGAAAGALGTPTLTTTGIGGGSGSGAKSVVFNHTGSFTLGVPLSGALAVRQVAGNTNLHGTNAHSGGTFILGGTLSINSASSLGNGSLTLNGGTLANSNGVVTTTATTLSGTGGTMQAGNGFLTFNGNVTGSGGLTKTGSGILTLNGAHSYGGPTTVSAGTLKFADNGATLSAVATPSIALAAGTTLIFNNSQTYAGTITGGTLTHEFAGTTTLTGAATPAATVITGGTLRLGNGGTTGSLTGNVSGTGTLAFERSDTISFGGVVSGTAGVSQTGGTLTLTAAHTSTGPLAVLAGRLILSGSWAGGFDVRNAARLSLSGGSVGSASASSTVVAGGLVDGQGAILGAVANGGTIAASGTGNTIAFSGGAVTNAAGGVLRAVRGAVLDLSAATSLTNQGTIDRITGTILFPASFTNSGLLLDSSSVRIKSATRAGSTVTIQIDGLDGHTYQLQVNPTLATGSTYVAVGTTQAGVTGQILTFTDPNASGAKGFYRVMVDP